MANEHNSSFSPEISQSQAEESPQGFSYSVSVRDFERQGFRTPETELHSLRNKLRLHARFLSDSRKIQAFENEQSLQRKLKWKDSKLKGAVHAGLLTPLPTPGKKSEVQQIPFYVVNACDLTMIDSKIGGKTRDRGGNAYYKLLLRVSQDEQLRLEAEARDLEQAKILQKEERKTVRMGKIIAATESAPVQIIFDSEPSTEEILAQDENITQDPLNETNLFELAYLASDPAGNLQDVYDQFQTQTEQPLMIQDIALQLLQTFDAISRENENPQFQDEWRALRDSSGIASTFDWAKFINYLEDLSITGATNVNFSAIEQTEKSSSRLVMPQPSKKLKRPERTAINRLARTRVQAKNKFGDNERLVAGEVFDGFRKLQNNGIFREIIDVFPDEFGKLGTDGVRRFSQADVAVLLTICLEIESGQRVLIDLVKIRKYKDILGS